MSQPIVYTIAVQGERQIQLLREEIEFISNAVIAHLGDDNITTVSNGTVTVSVK